jgi:pantetheine-phosphate adenylyltransferase
MKRIALFPGSFDPFTKGHADVAERAAQLFDEVIIGIGHNSNKKRFFSLELMMQKLNELYKDRENISIKQYEGLTARFAEQMDAQYMVRGLRNTTDFEYENSIAQANRLVFSDLETIFIITSPHYAHISSTIIRDLYRYRQDVSDFLPYPLADGLNQ